MSIFNKCEDCGRSKLFVKKRSYYVPQVHPKPIVGMWHVCGSCFRKTKKGFINNFKKDADTKR